MGKVFMTKTPKAIPTKAKIDKWDLTKEFLHSKRNYYQSEQTTFRMGKKFWNLSDKSLISWIYNEFKSIYQKKIQPYQKVGEGYEQTLLKRRHLRV